MRTATIAAAALLMTATFAAPAAAAPAAAAPRPTGRPEMSAGQLIHAHDCHPVGTTPTKPVTGWLRDSLATPQRDLVYVRSHGMALFGTYRTTHYCYR